MPAPPHTRSAPSSLMPSAQCLMPPLPPFALFVPFALKILLGVVYAQRTARSRRTKRDSSESYPTTRRPQDLAAGYAPDYACYEYQ